MLVSSMSTPLSRRGQCELISIYKNDLDISHLEAHVLQEDSRRSLIVDRQPWSYPQSIDADILLERLAKLDPSVAEAFTAKSKALNGLVFRLVNESDQFQDETSYIAMSYCWKKIHHSPPLTHASVPRALPFGWVRTVEQFPLPTTPAMFQAVLRERENEYEGLWFDQVFYNP